MFCKRCGSELLGAAAFCSSCGFAAPSPLAASTAPPSPIPEKSTRGKYTWFCIDIAILSFLLAITIFNLTWMMYAGRLDEAVKSATGLILAIILLAVPANRLWKSILTLEPESDPPFKKKHKKFASVATACIGTLLAISLLGGILVGDSRAKQYAKDREISSLLSEFEAQKIKNAAFRKRLTEIRSVQPSTYEEYYQQCLTLERFLDQSRPTFEHTVALVASMSELVNKYPELRTPKILATVQFLKDMDDKDTQIFGAARDEISKVKELERLPNSQRTAFYNREIKPILANEEKLVKEEYAILLKGQQDGIEIPSDLSESLKKQ